MTATTTIITTIAMPTIVTMAAAPVCTGCDQQPATFADPTSPPMP